MERPTWVLDLEIQVITCWYRWDIDTETWTQMTDFPGEGRVAGTQFSIGDRGFVLSGDSDSWSALPPHPGPSRWAPGSFTIGNVV